MRKRNPSRRVHFALIALLVLLLTVPSGGHNSGVVHTEITDVAFELMRTHDMSANGVGGGPGDVCVSGSPARQVCAYEELWRNRGSVKPLARDEANVEDIAHAPYVADFNAGIANGIVGVVVEDGIDSDTELRVVNHFYHAVSGVGLLNANDSSYERSGELFEFSLKMHDYVPATQQRSYIYMGRFLHHVEDMSSPAHVHNDAHLYKWGIEFDKDDYEGRYVPLELWVNSALRPELVTAMAPQAITSANRIWPAPQAAGTSPPNNSLAGFVFNMTTYYATLEFPLLFSPSAAGGELALMFPGELADPADNGLHWEFPPLQNPRWVIDGVGNYRYISAMDVFDAWWPDTDADGVANFDPDGVTYQYYIEQLMSGETADTGLQPERIRSDWTQPFSGTNLMRQNTVCVGGTNPGAPCSRPANCTSGVCQGDSLVELQGQELLAPAVEYVAGAAKWWYEYANLPPYLRAVEAKQGPSMDIKYTAEWVDVSQSTTLDLVESGTIGDTHEAVALVNSRTLTHIPGDRKYINALTDLKLRLDFNESIRQIDQLQLLNSSGGVEKDVLAAVAGQTSNNVPVIEGTCWNAPTMVCTQDSECPNNTRCLLDSRWTYTLEMASLAGLNGALTLSVKAIDMNVHQQDGEQLDETPQSPAKRNLIRTCVNDPAKECTSLTQCSFFADCRLNLRAPNIPWYTDETDEDFAYHFGTGDRNHLLLFDTEPPNATIATTP